MKEKKFFDYRNVYRNLETGKSSTWLHEVVDKEIAIRANLEQWFLSRRSSRVQTPFEKVSILSPPFQSFPTHVRKEISFDEFAQGVFEIVCNTIEGYWNPAKPHVIPHSSGHDSNLISLALHYLREKNGDKWFGDTVFVECDGEHNGFQQIMEILQFDNTIFARTSSADEVREPSLNFENAWYRTNSTPMPINIWFESFLLLDEDLSKMKDYQFIIGYGANEIKSSIEMGHTPSQYVNQQYYSIYSNVPLPSDCLVPFMSLDFIQYVFEHGWQFGDYRANVLYTLDPRMKGIERMSWEHKFSYYRMVSDRLINRTYQQYIMSWYGKTISPYIEPTKSLMPSAWWGHWALASLCEHLGKL